nr:hypothetical protein [Jeotgalibacillus malaysiensis]
MKKIPRILFGIVMAMVLTAIYVLVTGHTSFGNLGISFFGVFGLFIAIFMDKIITKIKGNSVKEENN